MPRSGGSGAPGCRPLLRLPLAQQLASFVTVPAECHGASASRSARVTNRGDFTQCEIPTSGPSSGRIVPANGHSTGPSC